MKADETTGVPEEEKDAAPLYNADPGCAHEIETLWSGYRCKKCTGWYCL